MLEAAKELIVWASKLEARLHVEIHEGPPDSVQREAINRIHPDLGPLYSDHSGVAVSWELDQDCYGRLWFLTPDEMICGASNSWKDWSDAEIIETVIAKHDDPDPWLPIARSLVAFHDYGNGDALCVSQLNDKIYYQDHEEGELIYVANNLDAFYRGWSDVRFVEPKWGWRDVGSLGRFSNALFELPNEPADLETIELKDILFRTTRKLTAGEVRQFANYFKTQTNLVQLKKYLESENEISLVRWKREDKLGEHLELLSLMDAQYRVVDSCFDRGFSSPSRQ